MKFVAFGIAASLFGLALLPTAHAADVPTAVAVHYGDLDLGQPSGARTLYHRLQAAALEACGASEFSLAPYQDAVRRSACYRDGLDNAVQAVNLPAVSALYVGRPTALAAN